MRITQHQLRQIIREEAARFLREGVDDDLGGAASATDSGDREGRRGEHLGDDPDMGPPGHDDWHIDRYEDEDIEGSDFDEMIDPADDNDDPMSPAWMKPSPYADTAPDDLTLTDDPYVGGRAASAAIRQKYSETGDSDPEDDRSPPRGHRYGVSGGWGGLDESDPGDDGSYAAHLQAQHGEFTSPENIPGTHAHKKKHGSPAAGHGGGYGGGGYVSRRSEWGDPDLFGGPPRVDEARWAKLAGVLKD